MISNDESNEHEPVRSKIEQLRIDLEKKLTALESKKSTILKKNQKKIEITLPSERIEPKFEIDVEKVKNLNEVKKITPSNPAPAFEIFEPIEKIKKETTVNIQSKTEKITVTSINEKTPNTLKIDSTIETTQILKESKKNLNTIKSNSETEISNKVEYGNYKERVSKSKNYLLYALLTVLLLSGVYFLFDFLKKSKSKNQIKQDRIISVYKNKSYLDSIELVDANNKIVDIQNQKLIDSLDFIFQNELKKNNEKKPLISQTKRKATRNSKKSKDKASPVLELSSKNKTRNSSTIILKPKDIAKIKSDDKKSLANINDKLKSKLKENITKNNSSKIPIVKKTKNITFPIYPGCENKKSNYKRKRCSTVKIVKYIQRNFNSEIANDIGLKEGMYKIKVYFVIGKNGKATVLNVRGAENKQLEKEAIRVVHGLPKMAPGLADGSVTSTPYTVPISFSIVE